MDSILEAIKKTPIRSGQHSSLWLWMYRFSERFEAALNEAGGADWHYLAGVFHEHGLTARDGVTVTPASARQTWFRVRRAKQRAARKGAAIEQPIKVEARPGGKRPAVTLVRPTAPAAPAAPANSTINDAVAKLRAQRSWLPSGKKAAQ